MSTGGDKDCVEGGTQDSVFIDVDVFCGAVLTQSVNFATI